MNPIDRDNQISTIKEALNSQKRERLVYDTKMENFFKVNRKEAKRLERDGRYETKLESLKGRVSAFVRENKIEDIGNIYENPELLK